MTEKYYVLAVCPTEGYEGFASTPPELVRAGSAVDFGGLNSAQAYSSKEEAEWVCNTSRLEWHILYPKDPPRQFEALSEEEAKKVKEE